jgi:hypothetical protein
MPPVSWSALREERAERVHGLRTQRLSGQHETVDEAKRVGGSGLYRSGRRSSRPRRYRGSPDTWRGIRLLARPFGFLRERFTRSR